MVRIMGKARLTRAELEEILNNSGITSIQYEIIRLKYYDRNHYSVVKICDILSISVGTYGYQLRQAIKQVNAYFENK
jgi:hypothetical protein